MQDAEILEERQQALDWMVALPRANRRQRFAWAEELAVDFRKSRAKVDAVLQYWIGWWRDVILERAACRELITNVDFEKELQDQAGQFSLAEARSGLRAVEMVSGHLRANVNARLALEVMMLALPKAS